MAHCASCPPPTIVLPVPRLVLLQVEQEEKERRKKEKAEAHLYTLVRVSTDEDLRGQIGSSHFFDLADHDKVGACSCQALPGRLQVRLLLPAWQPAQPSPAVPARC